MSTADNSKNNHITAFILAACFLATIVFHFLPYRIPLWITIPSLAFTLVFAILNFKADATVDNWVGAGGVIVAIAAIISHVAWISSQVI